MPQTIRPQPSQRRGGRPAQNPLISWLILFAILAILISLIGSFLFAFSKFWQRTSLSVGAEFKEIQLKNGTAFTEPVVRDIKGDWVLIERIVEAENEAETPSIKEFVWFPTEEIITTKQTPEQYERSQRQ